MQTALLPTSGPGWLPDQRIVSPLYLHYIRVWSTGSTAQELPAFLQMKDPATEASLYMWLAQAQRSLVSKDDATCRRRGEAAHLAIHRTSTEYQYEKESTQYRVLPVDYLTSSLFGT